MIRIGIIGAGYWGPNLIRCFQESTECEVVYICDRDEKKRKPCQRFPRRNWHKMMPKFCIATELMLW